MSDEIQNTELNEENIAKVLAGEEDYSILTEAELDEAADRQYRAEQGEDVIEQKVEPTETPEEPQAPIEDDTSNIVPLNENERLRDALAEKHRLEQLLKDREDRIEKAKADPKMAEKLLGLKTEVIVDPEKDYLDDRNLAQMEAELNNLKQWREERERRDAERDAEIAHTQEKLNVFSEINSLQSEFQDLQTSKPFQKIDESFRNWQDTAIASNVDVDKFLSDDAYRKKAEEAGHKLNVSKEDLDKALKIWDLNSKYNAEKKQGYNTSLKHVFAKSPMYEQAVKAKYSKPLDAHDNAIAEKLREREAEPQILSPSSNAGEAGGDEVLKTAIMGMEALSMKTSFGPADQKQWDEYQKIIDRYDQY